MAVNCGMTAVISRCVGAGDYEQARYYHRKMLGVVAAAHLAINAVIVASLPVMLRAYGLSAAAAELTAEIVLWHAALAVFLWPLAYMQPVTFRSAGDARYPMAIGLASMFLCRIVMAHILGSCLGMGVLGVFMAIFLDWFVKAALFTRRYLSGDWERFRIVELQ